MRWESVAKMTSHLYYQALLKKITTTDTKATKEEGFHCRTIMCAVSVVVRRLFSADSLPTIAYAYTRQKIERGFHKKGGMEADKKIKTNYEDSE
jgi:hypothetical protein